MVKLSDSRKRCFHYQSAKTLLARISCWSSFEFFFRNVSTFFAAKSSSNPSPQYTFILKLARSSYPQHIIRSGRATIIALQCVPVLKGMIRYFFLKISVFLK